MPFWKKKKKAAIKQIQKIPQIIVLAPKQAFPHDTKHNDHPT